MPLPRQTLSEYDKRLSGLESDAERSVRSAVLRLMSSGDIAVDLLRDFAIDAVLGAALSYGDAASALATDLYEAMAEAARAKVKAAVVDTSDIQGYVEKEIHYQMRKYLDGDKRGFAEACGKEAANQVSRRANQTMRQNAKRDGLRYARVPMGGETCTFCAMLASRGFVYKSESSAGKGNHFHRSCRCKVVPGFDGMEVEGYDPDEWMERWQAFKELDADKSISEKAREEAKRYLSVAAPTERNIAVATERAVADTYGEKMLSAWNCFKGRKTPERYEETMGAALREIGEASGIDLSGEYRARPDGDELWAALRLAKGEACMRYATNDEGNPDSRIDGALVEIKTPKRKGKITDRLTHAAKQFKRFPNEEKACILSLLRYEDGDTAEAAEIARRFVDDGTLDVVWVIDELGQIAELRK